MTKTRGLLVGAALALALAPGTWLRSEIELAEPVFWADEISIADLPQEIARDLGPFRLAEAWAFKGDTHRNHSYSAMALRNDNTMLLASDKGDLLSLTLPITAGLQDGASLASLNDGDPDRPDWRRDIEAIVLDEESGSLWLSVENYQSIRRLNSDLRATGWLRPRAMREWSASYGGEVMVGLDDGRFLIIPEARVDGSHHGLLFPDDPVTGAVPISFTLEMPGEFRPTEMVLLPDGGALILGRNFDLPFSFETAIAYLDLDSALEAGGGRARIIATISGSAMADNYEGMALARDRDANIADGPNIADGMAAIWIVSDNNTMQFMQRTLLLKLEFSLADVTHD